VLSVSNGLDAAEEEDCGAGVGLAALATKAIIGVAQASATRRLADELATGWEGRRRVFIEDGRSAS
jgi:hypothetical protein